MTKMRMSAAVLVLLAVAGVARQDGDPAAAIAALQKQAKQHQTLLAAQDTAIKTLERRLEAAEVWFRGVPGTMAALDAALLQAEASGFTNAGANPRAREQLLAGLRGFATGLRTSLPSGAAPAK